jgi:nucleoside-diphosphate-sugar epimerase
MMKHRPTRPINLGNPQEMSIRELAQLVLELTGANCTVEHRPLPSDDPTRRRPEISRARGILGGVPRVSPRVGITETIAYYRSRIPVQHGTGHHGKSRVTLIAAG